MVHSIHWAVIHVAGDCDRMLSNEYMSGLATSPVIPRATKGRPRILYRVLAPFLTNHHPRSETCHER